MKLTNWLKSRLFRSEKARRLKRCGFRPRLLMETLEERSLLATFYVATTGLDTNPGTAAQPFLTIQRAINGAPNSASSAIDGDDVINVAAGTYSPSARITTGTSPNLTNLQLLGGWDASFTARSPSTTPTIVMPTYAYASVTPYDFSIAKPNTTIDGFYFVFDGTYGFGGTRASAGVGVGNGGSATGFVFSNNTVEVGSSFSGEAPGKSAGIVTLANSASMQVKDNVFMADGFNNIDPGTFGDASHAIFINPDAARTAATQVTISGNTITGSRLASAIVVDTQGFVNITNNTIARTLTGNSFFDLIGLRARSVAGAMTNVTITGNTLDGNNRAGSSAIQLGDRGGSQAISGVTISNNFIRNTPAGLLVGPLPGDGTQTQSISATLVNNSFENNSSNIVFMTSAAGSSEIDASGNWWGTNSEAGVVAKISGTTPSKRIDFTPYLDNGADTNLVTLGHEDRVVDIDVAAAVFAEHGEEAADTLGKILALDEVGRGDGTGVDHRIEGAV